MLDRVLIGNLWWNRAEGAGSRSEAGLVWRGVQGAGGSLRDWSGDRDWGKRAPGSGGAPWERACGGDGGSWGGGGGSGQAQLKVSK